MPLRAQCPDGTPPPCRSASVTPPLDQRAWLILPFTNTSRSTDAALVADASVNLLYQDLSRWSEIRVISDDRVADLVRHLPSAERQRIGLTTGLTLARRVGAGRLVLGDYLAAGGNAQIAARVYDVRTGRQVRAVHERLIGYGAPGALDSLTSTFDRVARGLLELRAPARGSYGLGTGSLEAFRAFQSGMAFYREGRLDSARQRFGRAVALDSNYAWAHLRLYWVSANQGAEFAAIRRHLDEAARLAAALPPRERAIIGGFVALPLGQVDVLCARAAELLGADSTDVEAWHFRGHCLAGDRRMVRDARDTTRFMFRSDLTGAARAYERGTLLDPAHTEAFADLIALLRLRFLTGCAEPIGSGCPEDRRYVGIPLGDADSIILSVLRVQDAGVRPENAPAALTALRQRLDRALAAAARHTAALPASWEGRYTAAALLLARGASLEAAARELDAAGYGRQLLNRRRALYRDYLELLLRRERPDSARMWLDSLAADSLARSFQNQYYSTFGLFSRDFPFPPDSVRLRAARVAWLPVFAGVLPPGFEAIEQQWAATVGNPRQALETSTVLAFRMRGTGPALDTAASHPIRRAQAWLAHVDTARARAATEAFDAELAARGTLALDDAGWLFAAEMFVALGDSTRALARLADWALRYPAMYQLQSFILDLTALNATPRLAGRTWLLYGDLAARLGRPADARRAYRMVLGLWEGGEAPVQPLVARARAALAGLGN